MREKIAKWFMSKYEGNHSFVYDEEYGDLADQILSLLAPELEKAKKWERYQHEMVSVINKEIIAKADKWDKLKSLFDTSCAKCFLNHICGTHGNPGAVCEDIKESVEGITQT